MNLLNLINSAQNDDDIINIFKEYNYIYVDKIVKENINYIHNNKYINYLKYFNNWNFLKYRNYRNKYYYQMKKYHNLNKKLYYFSNNYKLTNNKLKYYHSRSLKYMITNNIKTLF